MRHARGLRAAQGVRAVDGAGHVRARGRALARGYRGRGAARHHLQKRLDGTDSIALRVDAASCSIVTCRELERYISGGVGGRPDGDLIGTHAHLELISAQVLSCRNRDSESI